jgi:hypothetical protein
MSFILSRRQRFFIRLLIQACLGSHEAPSQWVPLHLSSMAIWPEREDDHSLPSGVRVNKAWIFSSSPSKYALVTWLYMENFVKSFI